MTTARPRPWLVALLAFALVGWLAWLGWLALPTTTPREVLARPQFLVSTLDVIARIDANPAGKPTSLVTVEEAVWPAEPQLAGKPLTVANLERCEGWQGPGSYILPLVGHGDTLQVALIPRSPGFEGALRAARIYLATPLNREQLKHLPPKPALPAGVQP